MDIFLISIPDQPTIQIQELHESANSNSLVDQILRIYSTTYDSLSLQRIPFLENPQPPKMSIVNFAWS